MDLPALYHELIIMIGDRTGASDNLLHVHAGMTVMLLARVLTRRSLATPVPFLCVCAAELANEVADRLTFGSWRLRDTTFDVLNTLFWPAVLMLSLRVWEPRGRRSIPRDGPRVS